MIVKEEHRSADKDERSRAGMDTLFHCVYRNKFLNWKCPCYGSGAQTAGDVVTCCNTLLLTERYLPKHFVVLLENCLQAQLNISCVIVCSSAGSYCTPSVCWHRCRSDRLSLFIKLQQHLTKITRPVMFLCFAEQSRGFQIKIAENENDWDRKCVGDVFRLEWKSLSAFFFCWYT